MWIVKDSVAKSSAIIRSFESKFGSTKKQFVNSSPTKHNQNSKSYRTSKHSSTTINHFRKPIAKFPECSTIIEWLQQQFIRNSNSTRKYKTTKHKFASPSSENFLIGTKCSKLQLKLARCKSISFEFVIISSRQQPVANSSSIKSS